MNKRLFIPGDEWLYYKIYCGPKTADVVLKEVVKPTADFLIENSVIDKWFFIRYNDPKYHIRFRMHFVNEYKIIDAMQCLNSNLSYYTTNKLVWNVVLDTYKREIERYGDSNIALSELLFYFDSEATIKFLHLIDGDEGEELKGLYSLLSMDNLLQDFNFTLGERKDLLGMLEFNFGQELNIDKMLRGQLSAKFRENKRKIIHFFNNNSNCDSEYYPIYKVLNDRSIQTKLIADKIIDILKQNGTQLKLNNVIASYIHMLNNRLFKSSQRIHELVVYYNLLKYYNFKENILKK